MGVKGKNQKEGGQREQSCALVYVRVSTAAQAKTDRDGEGFSIAAQRDACLHKAESLDAEVLEVYVDSGESARKADRPELQRMLVRFREQRDANYVIALTEDLKRSKNKAHLKQNYLITLVLPSVGELMQPLADPWKEDLKELIDRLSNPVDAKLKQVDLRAPGERAEGVLSF